MAVPPAIVLPFFPSLEAAVPVCINSRRTTCLSRPASKILPEFVVRLSVYGCGADRPRQRQIQHRGGPSGGFVRTSAGLDGEGDWDVQTAETSSLNILFVQLSGANCTRTRFCGLSLLATPASPGMEATAMRRLGHGGGCGALGAGSA